MKVRKHFSLLFTGLALLTVGCTISPTAATSSTKAQLQPTESAQNSQDTITIIGASTPYPAMELLAEAYKIDPQSKAANVQIAFQDSSQSSGGIAAVKQGLAQLGTVTRSPKSKEAHAQLSHREFAKDGLLVATHPSVTGLENLTTEDLQSIYSGKATNWEAFGGPDAEIVVLDRAEDTSAKRLLREHYLGAELANAPSAIMLRRESDIIEALQETPYSIGVLSHAKAIVNDLPINHLSLNSIALTSENLASDRYPMHRTLGLVWYGEPTSTTQSFTDFIFSPAGAETLQQAGYTPSPP